MTETTMPEFDTVEDLVADAAQNVAYHTILEVWREVLKPARVERTKKITPQWANRIVTTYQGLGFADMEDFRDLYFDKIGELEDILAGEIESDDECLNVTTPEEDVEHNGAHYFNVLINWQKTFLTWELEWHPADDLAGVELAAISEVHRMFFDSNGLTALLDQIKFEFTDDDRDLLAAELNALREAQED
jgi:hypothetical protein